MKYSGLGATDVHIEEKTALSSGFLKLWLFKLRHRLFNGGQGPLLEREAIVRPPSVGVLLYNPRLHSVVLVEQFRLGPLLADDDPWLLEVVAGISEPGESLREVALREVQEESGCQKVHRLIEISDFYMSPGASNEKMKLYCGIIDASQAGGLFGLAEEGEDIRAHVLPFAQAYQMVGDGRIANAPAIIALQWLKLHYKELASG